MEDYFDELEDLIGPLDEKTANGEETKDEESLLDRLVGSIEKGLRKTKEWTLESLFLKTRSYLLVLGLVLLYRLSLKRDALSQTILSSLAFLNGFSSAWVSRFRGSLGKARFVVYIGKAFRLLYKYIGLLVPSVSTLKDACRGRCGGALASLETLVKKAKASTPLLLNQPLRSYPLVPTTHLPSGSPYTLKAFHLLVDRVSTFWLMLSLLFVLARGRERPSPFHWVGASIKLVTLLDLMKELTSVHSVSGLLNGLGEALPSLTSLFHHLVFTYASRLPHTLKDLFVLSGSRPDEAYDLYYPKTSLDLVHSSLLFSSACLMVLFAIYLYLLRK